MEPLIKVQGDYFMKVRIEFEVEDICENETELQELIDYNLKQGLIQLPIKHMEINYE